MSNKLCTNITGWIPFASELQSTYIIVNVVNGLCSFVAVVGNAVMILAILRNSSLRTPPFMLLCNLVISDLGVGLITQPLFIALRVAEAKGDIKLSCKLGIAYSFTAGCLAVLSLFTITAISFERFLAVHLGLSYRRVSSVVTVKRMKMVISLLWFVTILMGITYAIDSSIFYLLMICGICLCLIFATFSYLAIARKLDAHSAKLQAHSTDVDDTKQRTPFNIGQYKKTLKSMLYVYGVFLLCYLPYLCFTITLTSIGRTSTVYTLYIVTTTLPLANSAINPCLYCWRITEVREAVRRLFSFGRLAVREREATPASTSESIL